MVVDAVKGKGVGVVNAGRSVRCVGVTYSNALVVATYATGVPEATGGIELPGTDIKALVKAQTDRGSVNQLNT